MALAIAIVVGLVVVQPVMALPIPSVSSGGLQSILALVIIAFASLIVILANPLGRGIVF